MRHVRILLRLVLGTVVVGVLTGCFGWWTSESIPTLRFQLLPVDASMGVAADDVVAVLTGRLIHGGFSDARVIREDDGLAVVIHDTSNRVAPLHLFERGGFTVHRVDELQSKGSDRVARQVLSEESIQPSDPPEKLWDVLREASLLPPDRWAYFSRTDDGREELLFVQSNAFLQHDLFASSRVVTTDLGCHVEAQWSERLSSVLSDRRLRASGQRVALMMDGELLGFRRLDGLWNAEHPFRLTTPDQETKRGGRRVWSVSEDAETWCRDISAVLDSGPLPFALRVGEMTTNSP